MKLWGSLKRLWRRWTGGLYAGPTLSENQVTDKVAEDLVSAIEKMGKVIVRQVIIEANKVGLPPSSYPYLFWVLLRDRSGWPKMHKINKRGLGFLQTVLSETGEEPSFQGAFPLPPAGKEALIDKALDALGLWAAAGLGLKILKVYHKSLSKWEGAMQKATADRLPPDKARTYLKVLFETQVERNPAQFYKGYLIDEWMFMLN